MSAFPFNWSKTCLSAIHPHLVAHRAGCDVGFREFGKACLLAGMGRFADDATRAAGKVAKP